MIATGINEGELVERIDKRFTEILKLHRIGLNERDFSIPEVIRLHKIFVRLLTEYEIYLKPVTRLTQTAYLAS